MRKSSLILLLAMAFVLTTVVSGFCVVNEIGEPCVACEKKDSNWRYGLQIQMSDCDVTAQDTAHCPCPMFDYEQGTGYCPTQSVQGVVFKLCDCEKIDEMSTASNYAIRLTIMEPASGVYWTTDNTQKATPCTFNTVACPPTGTDSSIFVSSHQDPMLDPIAANRHYCIDPCDADSASRTALDYFSATAGQQLYNPATADADCCFTCGTNRVKAIQSCYAALLVNQESVLVIDSPQLVYDPNDINVQLGAQVKVKVEIVEEPDAGDICVGACKSICECLVLFGEFTDCSPSGCQLCLPYLPAANSGWWAGMAFTNNCSKPALVELNFFAAGTTASYTFTIAAKTVDTIILSDIIGSLAGLATNAPIYVNVTGESVSMGLPFGSPLGAPSAEGMCGIASYVMMGNGTEAQGYVAPYGPCGCGVVGSLTGWY